jgi:hypothetical protein
MGPAAGGWAAALPKASATTAVVRKLEPFVRHGVFMVGWGWMWVDESGIDPSRCQFITARLKRA